MSKGTEVIFPYFIRQRSFWKTRGRAHPISQGLFRREEWIRRSSVAHPIDLTKRSIISKYEKCKNGKPHFTAKRKETVKMQRLSIRKRRRKAQ